MDPRACFIVAEIGVNHDGDVIRAIELIDAAQQGGADAVKFQSFSSARLASQYAHLANYQKDKVSAANQLEMLCRLELNAEEFTQLHRYCCEKSIEFMSTAFDKEWLDFLLELGLRRIKWPSGELTNLPFLEYAASRELPIVLSTGMADMDEVALAVSVIESAWCRSTQVSLDKDLTLLHCTSLYPAPDETLNVSALTALRDRFGTPVGYSDHSEGTVAAVMSIALGATLIEKHITYSQDGVGPDHNASLEPKQFAEFVRSVRRAEVTLGSGTKVPHPKELDTARAARKSVFVRRSMKRGSVLSDRDVELRRPGTGIGAQYTNAIVGRELACDVTEGQMLEWGHLRK